MIRLIWRESALDDLESIHHYIAERNWAAAEQLQEASGACVERLSEHPFLYRPGRVPGTREAVVHPNYIVKRVVHARQEYP